MQQGTTSYAEEVTPDPGGNPDPAANHSLLEDAQALYEDGKTYLEAELAFQKSRAGFVADRAKWTAVYGAGALALVHLALIALTVGLVISLATLIGPWLATAVVVIALLIGAAILLSMVRSKVNDIRSAFDGDGTS